ncbi:DUF1003 domain-containing protein [Massilia antarctica]|uniref:DUF1003 domain-containing protein n=1 Tax=Massilia antarctica TaxID=2765360 RepID=A0AA48WEN2_9BURK|nr:DUF1003 domain-containing protein [Massilia antarctica]QPI51225.1 DUF1003 domain-containing protein [Massilia antarctica]
MRTSRKDYLAHIEELQKRSGDTVAKHIAERRALTPNQHAAEDDATFGQRAADAVASFGGSWTFIMLFALVLVSWVVLNSFLLTRVGAKPFDPYPYILLNLFLSMLASIQAPVILMSQNRQGEIDRLNAQNDYEINLKAELEIMALHEKMDALKMHKITEMQHEQLRLLHALCQSHKVGI